MKTKKNKVVRVEVEWMDTTDISKWCSTEEVIDEFFHNKETFKTLGYLIKKSKDMILISTSIHFDNDGEVAKVACTWGIPTGCVRNIKYL